MKRSGAKTGRVFSADAARLNAVRDAVRASLLPWFARSARDLPWRRRRTAYRVLVAEVMLQQTRVDQAAPYYRRFLRAFPSTRALAAAPEAAVLKAWEGLGYYRRARQLQAAACAVVRRPGGRFPRTLEGLRALPGVGPYTAAAVGSLALGLEAAGVDGNVRRVLCRVFAQPGGPPGGSAARAVEAAATALLLPGRAGACNEAWMELGALLCVPRVPRCDACPLRRVCAGRATGAPARFPAPRAARRVPHKEVGAAVIRDRRGRFLIARRREGDMLGGLWEFPGGKREHGESMAACIARELDEEMGIGIEVGRCLARVRHAYSHFTMTLHAHEARLVRGRPRCLQCADYAWVRPADLDRYAFSRADRKIIEQLGPGKV